MNYELLKEYNVLMFFNNLDFILGNTGYLLKEDILIIGLPWCSNSKESACNAGDPGLIPGLGRAPGEGNGYPLQYSCLENPMDRESGGLQSMGSQRAGHGWVANTFTLSHTDYSLI